MIEFQAFWAAVQPSLPIPFDCSSIISPAKTWEHWIKGKTAMGCQNWGTLLLKVKHFGQ